MHLTVLNMEHFSDTLEVLEVKELSKSKCSSWTAEHCEKTGSECAFQASQVIMTAITVKKVDFEQQVLGTRPEMPPSPGLLEICRLRHPSYKISKGGPEVPIFRRL